MGVEEIKWSYKTIKESGSDELKHIIEIITGGNEPGRPIREGGEHEENSSH